MALVRRKRGEAVALPDGVVARMQLSPYRIQLAGIQTAPAKFQPLMREFESSGVVARTGDAATVLLEIPARQAPWVAEGQAADVACADLAGPRPDGGSGPGGGASCQPTAGNTSAPRSRSTDPPRDLRAGMIAVVRIKIPMAALEPFRSLPADPPQVVAGRAHDCLCLPRPS